MPAVIKKRNVGSPYIDQVGVDLAGPGRIAFEYAPAEFPGFHIFGTDERYPFACGKNIVPVIFLGNYRVVNPLDKALRLDQNSFISTFWHRFS